ncbi:TDG/mug DNA glucosyllase family protein [Sporothrix schenckii 1099-18]|uniref:TDG/mug DNA glucosyllase family protein n=1 Tax=Sporothrix schenckii 1099-18 TaxID=1397361 RepID=A0A0F2LSJ0_SPOSC|nr:TDG/mug DNA glucosyllase family protein [Sporothrix schenckii 1099-18]KJR79849.1 TDG/mug DNA glucosyllase family protein [Sporothrix schenckii 1099-18]
MAEDATPLPSFGGRLANFAYTANEDDAASPSSARSLRSRSITAPAVRSTPGSPAKSPLQTAMKRKLEDDGEADGTTFAAIPRFSGASARSTASSPSPSPTKQSRRSRPAKPSKYAPPTTYAHLPLLPDAIAPNLLVLFVGLNPGIETARSGHAYAHPSNLFWKLMYSSGVLPEWCTAQEDRTLPARFRLGLTNIVARPSRNGAELKPAELDAGVAILEAKARRWRPEVMCFVGKGIWDSVVRVRARQGRPKPAFKYGWQDESENMGVSGGDGDVEGLQERTAKEEILDDEESEKYVDEPNVRVEWKGARVFVASSTSGLAASLLPAEKEAIWRQLGSWVEQRRKEMKEKTG